MAIKSKQVLTIDLSKENIEYSASKKTALNLAGVENLDGIDVTTDGKNLYFKKGETVIAKISNFTGLKYSKLGSETNYTTDLISGGVGYTGTYSVKKKTVTGSNYNDTLNYIDYPLSTEDKLANKGLTINGGKGNDTITGTPYRDTITGGAGTNTINISVKSDKKFGNDTVVLTKGENLRLMLDVDKDDLGYASNNFLAEHLFVKDSGNDVIIEIYTECCDYDEHGVRGPRGELVGSITIKNYFKKDVLTNSGSFILVDKNGTPVTNLRYDRLRKDVYMDSESGHYNKTSYTGTWTNDYVDAEGFKLYKNGKKITTDSSKGEEITTETAGYEKVKGVTIKLGGSVDENEALGSIYADTIIGGAGDDYIWAGKGNDKITGGKGKNRISYQIGEGDDVVTLSKGENLTIAIEDESWNTLSVDKLDFQYANKNKDMIIYVLDDAGNRTGSITLKNFGKKDVVGSNGSVELYTKVNGSDVCLNLKTGEYTIGNSHYDKTDLYTTVTSKNFTGTWLSEYIDASDAYLTKTTGKGKNKQTVEKEEKDTGLTLKGGAGDDIVYGSKYSDKLYGGSGSDKVYGGKGNDTIYGDAGNDFLYGEDGNDTIKGGAGDDIIDGGKGNDKLYGVKGNNEFVFHANDGVDTIYSGKGTDSIRFADITDGALLKFDGVTNAKGKQTNDLKIYYGFKKDSYIIVKDYFKKSKGKYTTSVKNIYFGDSSTAYDLRKAVDDQYDNPDKYKDIFINESDSTSDKTVVGVENTKYVATGTGNDNINVDASTNAVQVDAGDGNNTVSAVNNKSTNYIYTGSGNDTITTGSGDDVIDAGDGTNTIDAGAGTNVITAGDGNQTITTGSGDDTIEVGDGLHNINAGLGANTITAGDNTSTENKGVISTGYNNDTITVGDGGYEIYTTGGNNIITAGDGNNVISENPENSYGVGQNIITTGSGDDNIYIKGYGQGTTINAGDGNNIIHYFDHGTYTGMNGTSGSAEITTGSGNDYITIGGYDEETSTWKSGSSNNTVKAGDGNNNVTIGHTSTHDNTVETGSGNDTITTFGYNNVIKAGDGVNTVTVDGNNAYGNKVTTGSGDDTITLGNGSNSETEEDWNVINAGDGHNTITVGSGTFNIKAGDSTITDTEDENYNKGSNIILGKNGSYNEYTTVTTGSGNDTVEFKGYVYNSEIDLGDGDNDLTFRKDTGYTNISAGSGDDTLTLEDSFYGEDKDNRSKIDLGAGKNTVTTEYIYNTDITTTGDEKQTLTVNNMGDYVNISTGTGNDEINVSSCGYNSTITTTGGNNKITYGANMDGWGGNSLGEDYHYGSITTGSGDDEITIGTFDEDGNTLGGVQGTIIQAGDGENVIKVADQCSYTQITTGKDKDIITLGASSQSNTINAGDGDNEIYIAKDGSTYGNDTITTGSGNDTITIGDINSYKTTINAGSGVNTITVGNTSYSGIDITTTGDDIQNITVGKSDELSSNVNITTGGGNDNITILGDADGANITSSGGNNQIKILNTDTYDAKITTGSGNDNINFKGYYSKIYAGAGDNTIVATNTGNTIETGGGKDDITIGDGSNNWAYNVVNIGHAERDVKGDWNDEIDDYDYTHEQALEGGAENTVTLNDAYNTTVSIYNTSTVEDKYNTINVTGNSDRVYINVSDGHTKVNFNTELNQGSSNEITTGSGDDEITGFLSSTIDAGDGDNTVTMRKYQNGYSSNITTGSGKDKIDIYDYAEINSGAGDDIINAHVVDAENYGGSDPEDRGYYIIDVTMGAGNDTLNIDEGFKGDLYLNFKLGDGASNVINGITDSIPSISIDIDPNGEYYVRPSESNTDLEIVLFENGAETGDVMTLKGLLKDQADHEPIIHDIYINGNSIGNKVSTGVYDEELGEWIYKWEYYVPTSNDFIINGDHSQSGLIEGDNDNNVIYGSDYDDIIKPKNGDDVIRPGKGNDVIDLESNYGRKSIHFNIGDGNLTIQNTLQYTVSLYMEGVESGDFTIEKRGKDYCIVRSNGETLTIKDLYDDDGYMGYYNVYIYDKDGNGYNYIGAFAIDSKIDKPIHIYAPEDAETYELVADHYSKSIFHVSDNVTSIVTNGNSDVVIYGMPYSECENGGTQVKINWSSSAKFSRYVREGDNLLIKTAINEDYFYTNEEYMWADWNMRTTTVVDFFKEHNKVDFFVFGGRGINYDSIVSEAMTQAVNKTTDDGETLTKPQDDDWWMGSYTYNAGDGNDTIIATGNADIAYGNGGNDNIYMYNPGNLEEYGASGLFDGGEGNDTYYVKFAPAGTHTIVADKGNDVLYVADGKDAESGVNFDVTDTNTYSMSADGKDIVLTSDDYYIDHKFVIKDALFKKIDLTISDTVDSRTLKDMMEANNIYSSCYQDNPENLYGSTGNDTLYALEDCNSVYGFRGSDTIYAFGDKTVYTLGGGEPGDDGFKDIEIGTIDTVELYGMHNTVYAQSETNIINSYNRDSYWDDNVLVKNTDDYFAHIDQSTTINDVYGNDSLTIMNTYLTEDGQYKIDGMQNLFVMCDYGDDYYGNYDILLFNNANLLKWQAGNDLDNDTSNDPKYIRIKYNEIETITTSDGYTITSEQLSELASAISDWMYYGNDYEQYFGSMDGLRDGNHAGEMNALVQYVQDQAASMWTQG